MESLRQSFMPLIMDGTLERIVYFGFALWIIAELRAVKGVVAGIKDVVPVVLSPSQMQNLHESTFAILDREGHPVGCGFFVTACGVALTAAHASLCAVGGWLKKAACLQLQNGGV